MKLPLEGESRKKKSRTWRKIVIVYYPEVFGIVTGIDRALTY